MSYLADVKTEQYITETQRWIANFVIGLNLCPFARVPYDKGRIRYRVYTGDNAEELAMLLADETLLLQNTPPEETETTLLIHPRVLTDFLDYNDFLSLADNILLQTGAGDSLQIASFHPDYQFAETQPDDAENFTNRSPYPMLHLLREASVSRATEHHPDPAAIPDRNIALLRGMQREEILRLAGKKF